MNEFLVWTTWILFGGMLLPVAIAGRRTPQTEMVCAMTVGTVVGWSVGIYLPIAAGISFFYATVIAMGAGTVAGWVAGWRGGIRGVLEGSVSGWMGGMMGPMLEEMVSPRYVPTLFHLTSVLVAGSFFLVYLLLDPVSSVLHQRRELVWRNRPVVYLLWVLCFLLSSHFYPLSASEESPGHLHGGGQTFWYEPFVPTPLSVGESVEGNRACHGCEC
ncbi:hypothetical protein [Paludifilum halophilum]|uniref:Uncharacterized protein n=1 Tax=Paludifilum halophilum TaxID=1642702 RepID=A0A235B8S1_9BACL|nr:hypothetical protein [Paludifilum halophilum]OYD08389.1 hypothetical protein CHM34_06020 [Paludifilum halophilum]